MASWEDTDFSFYFSIGSAVVRHVEAGMMRHCKYIFIFHIILKCVEILEIG
jgi:hypothetical protein